MNHRTAPHRSSPASLTRVPLLVLLGVIAVVLAGCAGTTQPDAWSDHVAWMDEMHRSMWGDDGPSESLATPRPGAVDLRVTATEFEFTPARLELVVGSTANLALRNDGALAHDLTTEGADFRLVAQPGETAEALLPQLSPGEYRIYCSIPGHAAAGMAGTLVVSAVAGS